MLYKLSDFETVIRQLPDKEKFTKEDLLIPELLVEKQGKIELYYAPHNEYMNLEAKIFIVGITPGFQQMSAAILAAKRGFESGLSLDVITYECKKEARFRGPMRTNIIQMLDELGMNEKLGLSSCSSLFEEKDSLLHTVSMIPYAVFVNGKNYTGHTPELIKTPLLMDYVYESFLSQYEKLDRNVFVVPLGKAVEQVLDLLSKEGKLNQSMILKGFPHPSGANGNRKKQFEENKEQMRKIITNAM